MEDNIGAFKAFRIHQHDKNITAGFETLGLEDLSPGEVLIRTKYSGINYKDALAATGVGKILKSFPLIGGIDASGIVEQSDHKDFKPGQRVVITGCGLGEEVNGGYAEFVRAKAQSVVPLPDEISCWQAMCVGTAGFTAALAITRLEDNGLTPDQGEVIVTGATGGVGSIAISMLSEMGYNVVALTGKRSEQEYLKHIGANRIMYRDELEFSQRPLEKALWSAAVDNVGGDILSWLTKTTNWWGSIASIGLASSHKLNTTVMPFILRGVNLLGINSVHTPRARRLAVWTKIARILRNEHFERVGTRTIPFSELPDSFDAYLEGAIVGRQVVSITESQQ